MKKTEEYQLNQWEINDRVRMEDFNADNARLEEILKTKFGRLQKLGSHAIGNGESFGAALMYTDDWDEWECLVGVLDASKTSFAANDYYEVAFQYPDFKRSEWLPRVERGSFALALFPGHDATRNIRGVILGSGSGLFFLDKPFQEIFALSIYLRNPNGATGSGASSTTFTDALWTVYGLK